MLNPKLETLLHEILDAWHRADEDDSAKLNEKLAELQTFMAGNDAADTHRAYII